MLIYICFICAINELLYMLWPCDIFEILSTNFTLILFQDMNATLVAMNLMSSLHTMVSIFL